MEKCYLRTPAEIECWAGMHRVYLELHTDGLEATCVYLTVDQAKALHQRLAQVILLAQGRIEGIQNA